jgi:cytosine/adenosine deaminase-related metal-dependent hydrolase
MENLEIKNAWIAQVSGKKINPVFGDLLMENGHISEIREKRFPDDLRREASKDKHTHNLAGRVVTSPLVNFHDHIYSRLAKGLSTRGPQDNFVHILENLWWKLDLALDPDMVRASAQMAALESIRNGVTYIFDHHASPRHTSGSLGLLADVLREYGLRGSLCFETSDRNGKELAHEALRENENLLKNQSEDIKGMLGLHALFTLEDSTLQESAKILKKHDTGIHLHLAEDKHDPEFSQQRYRLSLAQRLKKFDLLNQKSILVHGVHLTGTDYEIIKQSGAAIAYNPDSNLNNAVGLPVYADVPTEIPILAGTDGMHANIRRSLKQIFLLYRHQQNDFGAAFQFLQKIHFDQLDFVRKYFPDYPMLQPGDRADLIIWDYIPPAPFGADNYWGHYLYGMLERPIHSVMQHGKFLMENFQINRADVEQTWIQIYEQGVRLFKELK